MSSYLTPSISPLFFLHTHTQVVNCTTPASYYHVLRRQVHRSFRKPLIIATPKSLLRHKAAVSTMAEMSAGSMFRRLIPDTSAACAATPKKVRKLLLCTGRVYYDLDKHRADLAASDVAIVRVEQIAPFPFDLVAAEVARYPNAAVVWVQEEPRNMGYWTYVAPRIATATRKLNKKEVALVRSGGRSGTHGINRFISHMLPPPSCAGLCWTPSSCLTRCWLAQGPRRRTCDPVAGSFCVSRRY